MPAKAGITGSTRFYAIATPSCCNSQRLRSSPPPYFTSDPLAPIRR